MEGVDGGIVMEYYNMKWSGKQQKQKEEQIWDKLCRLKARRIEYGVDRPYQYDSSGENRILFRFPPEPNGYLHLGHARAIRLNYESANRLDGYCNLRFDDSNPTKEYERYVESIIRNIEWLGYEVDRKNIKYASQYFDKMEEYL